jgi:hypothetical protein
VWLFGGSSTDIYNEPKDANDLWQFDLASNEWAWISGTPTSAPSFTANGAPGVYGKNGVAAKGNTPGGRMGAATWSDSSGNLWLYGGWGEDQNPNEEGTLCDFWEFNTTTGLWKWVTGGNLIGSTAPAYGTEGKADALNDPGCRWGATGWTDNNDHLWMFGGSGFDQQANAYLNDVWEFDPATGLWTWMGGNSTANGLGVYGAQGVPAAANIPGARSQSSAWTDPQGHFWLFGGIGNGSLGWVNGVWEWGNLNDMWEFAPTTNEWTWISGSDTTDVYFGVPGVYGTLGVAAASNTPGGRYDSTSWVDGEGNFWIFGGCCDVKSTNWGYYSDLWAFSPAAKEWTWLGGSKIINIDSRDIGEYGTLGQPAQTNYPGAREGASGWTDIEGNLWLFGGYSAYYHLANELWQIQPSLTATFPKAAEPIFSFPAGTYKTGLDLSISDSTRDSVLFYTLDGTTPTSDSTYFSPHDTIFILKPTQTVKAVAIAPQYLDSDSAVAAYQVGASSTITVTPSATTIQADASLTVNVTLGDASGKPTPTGTVTLTSGSYTSAATTIATGVATVSIPSNSLAVGNDILTATYSGDAVYAAGNASAAVAVTAAPSFSIAGAALTVAGGATIGNTSSITITPSAFTGSVALTAAITTSPAGASNLPTLSFGATTPVNITSASAGSATLTVATTAPPVCSTAMARPSSRSTLGRRAVWACVLLAFIPLRRRKARLLFGALALLCACAVGMNACGGGSNVGSCTAVNSGTTPGSYTITVTGTSASLTETSTIKLTVQ